MSFEWQTEEDGDWKVQEAAAAGLEEPAGGRRWLLLIGALVLMVAAGVLVWREARQQVDAAEARIMEAVLASDDVARGAAVEGDRELLQSVLSARNRGWLQTQYELLEQGLLFGDVAQVLNLRPAAGDQPERTVEVDAELDEVVVTAEQAYQAREDGSTVTLQHTYVYRQGRDRWLLSPPLRDFWGEWTSVRHRYTTFSYPGRDEAVARRLAADLDEHLQEACTTYPKLSCDENVHLRVRFETDPDSLLALTEPGLGLGRQRRLSLPTPTLVGLPVDEAAYKALLRAYAAPVVTAAIAEAAGYECCTHVLFFEAAVNVQLAEMDIRPWPVTLDGYLAAADGLEDVDQLRRLWQWPFLAANVEVERWQAHALVEMMVTRGGTGPVTALQQAMLVEPGIDGWMRAATDFSSIVRMYEEWRTFIFKRIVALQMAPPPPQQELLAACHEGDSAVVQRYDPARDRWAQRPALSGYSFGALFPIGDDEGVLLTGRRAGSNQGQMLLWRPGSQRVLSQAQVGGRFYLSRGDGGWGVAPGDVVSTESLLVPAGSADDPLGQYAPVRVYDEGGVSRTPALLDLESCATSGGCRWRFISSVPVWSPDGEHMLVVNGRALLLLGARDGRSWEPVAAGRSPFWLSDDVYGYVTPEDRLVVRRVGERARQTVLDVEEVLPFLKDINLSRPVEVVAAVAGPPDSGALALVVGYEEQPARYLFLLQRPADPEIWLTADVRPEEMTLLLESNYLIFRNALPSFSPDGLWLAVHSLGGGGSGSKFWLFDARTGEEVLAGPAPDVPGIYDWSLDGRWLARWRGRGVVELIAPDSGPDGESYRRFVTAPLRIPSRGECTSLAWINR